jgi:hypothetical protein
MEDMIWVVQLQLSRRVALACADRQGGGKPTIMVREVYAFAGSFLRKNRTLHVKNHP